MFPYFARKPETSQKHNLNPENLTQAQRLEVNLSERKKQLQKEVKATADASAAEQNVMDKETKRPAPHNKAQMQKKIEENK